MEPTRFDDRHRSISYSSDWEQAGNPDEYEGTTSFAVTAGATASIRFTGMRITIFGTLTSFSSRASYRVDDGTLSTVTNPAPSDIQYGARFYDSGTLSAGSHTLVITYQSGAEYFLDYVEVYNVASPSISSNPPNSNTPSSQSSSAGVTSVPSTDEENASTSSIIGPYPSPSSLSSILRSSQGSSLTPTASGSNPGPSDGSDNAPSGSGADSTNSDSTGNSGKDNKSSPVAATIAGVLGGVIAILCLVIAFLVVRRRRRTRRISGQLEGARAQPFYTNPRQYGSGNVVQVSELGSSIDAMHNLLPSANTGHMGSSLFASSAATPYYDPREQYLEKSTVPDHLLPEGRRQDPPPAYQA